MLYKYCEKCKKLKPITKFYKNKTTEDGYANFCCDCEKLRQRKLYDSQFNAVDRNKVQVYYFLKNYKPRAIAREFNYKLKDVRMILAGK